MRKHYTREENKRVLAREISFSQKEIKPTFAKYVERRIESEKAKAKVDKEVFFVYPWEEMSRSIASKRIFPRVREGVRIKNLNARTDEIIYLNNFIQGPPKKVIVEKFQRFNNGWLEEESNSLCCDVDAFVARGFADNVRGKAIHGLCKKLKIRSEWAHKELYYDVAMSPKDRDAKNYGFSGFLFDPIVFRWAEERLLELGIMHWAPNPNTKFKLRQGRRGFKDKIDIEKSIELATRKNGKIDKSLFQLIIEIDVFEKTKMVRISETYFKPRFPKKAYKNYSSMRNAWEGFKWLFNSYGWGKSKLNKDVQKDPRGYYKSPAYISVYSALGRHTCLERYALMHDVKTLRVKSLNRKALKYFEGRESIPAKSFAKYFFQDKGAMAYKLALRDELEKQGPAIGPFGKQIERMFEKDRFSGTDACALQGHAEFQKCDFAKIAQVMIKGWMKNQNEDLRSLLIPSLNIVKLFPKKKMLQRLFSELNKEENDDLDIHGLGQNRVQDGCDIMAWSQKCLQHLPLMLHAAKFREAEEVCPHFKSVSSRDLVKVLENMKLAKIQDANERIYELLVKSSSCSQHYYERTLMEWESWARDECGKTHESIPNVHVQSGTLSWERVSCDDPLNIVIGQITGCCQHWDGAAADLTFRALEKHDTCTYIFKKGSSIDGTILMWRDGDTLVFDNIEHKGTGRELPQGYRELLMKFAQGFIGKLGIKRVICGTSDYGVGEYLFKDRDSYCSSARLGHFTGYMDYRGTAWHLAGKQEK